jgi:murein DD-endopeptidase MepM/ murein hydrolase activator NlpD
MTPAAPPRRGWTLLFLPPARVPGAVRTVVLGRRHLLMPLAAVVVVLAAVSFAAGRVGGWLQEARVAPELAQMQDRAWAAEARLHVVMDSLGALRAEVAALAAAAEARRDLAAVAGAARPSAPASRPSAGLALPLQGRITSRFSRSRLHPILRIRRPHKGVDIAAASGTPIRAPAPGRVTKVAREIGYGLIVQLDHGGGVTTRFAHCRSALVRVGQRVEAGARIATVGATGLATTPHLHYEVRVRGEAVDPLRVTRR